MAATAPPSYDEIYQKLHPDESAAPPATPPAAAPAAPPAGLPSYDQIYQTLHPPATTPAERPPRTSFMTPGQHAAPVLPHLGGPQGAPPPPGALTPGSGPTIGPPRPAGPPNYARDRQTNDATITDLNRQKPDLDREQQALSLRFQKLEQTRQEIDKGAAIARDHPLEWGEDRGIKLEIKRQQYESERQQFQMDQAAAKQRAQAYHEAVTRAQGDQARLKFAPATAVIPKAPTFTPAPFPEQQLFLQAEEQTRRTPTVDPGRLAGSMSHQQLAAGQFHLAVQARMKEVQQLGPQLQAAADQLAPYQKKLKAGELSPADERRVVQAGAALAHQIKQYNATLKAYVVQDQRAAKFLAARMAAGFLPHGGDKYPEELAAEQGHPAGWIEQNAPWVGRLIQKGEDLLVQGLSPQQVAAKKDARARLGVMMVTGEDPPLPPNPGKTPLERKQFIDFKNQVRDYIKDWQEAEDVRTGRWAARNPGAPPLAPPDFAYLAGREAALGRTHWGRVLIQVLRAQSLAGAKAEDQADVSGAWARDTRNLILGLLGGEAAGGLAGGVLSKVLTKVPSVAALLSEPLFGAGAKGFLKGLGVRVGTRALTSAGGFTGFGATHAGVTASDQGQGLTGSLRAAARAVPPSAKLGAVVGAGEALVGVGAAALFPKLRAAFPGATPAPVTPETPRPPGFTQSIFQKPVTGDAQAVQQGFDQAFAAMDAREGAQGFTAPHEWQLPRPTTAADAQAQVEALQKFIAEAEAERAAAVAGGRNRAAVLEGAPKIARTLTAEGMKPGQAPVEPTPKAIVERAGKVIDNLKQRLAETSQLVEPLTQVEADVAAGRAKRADEAAAASAAQEAHIQTLTPSDPSLPIVPAGRQSFRPGARLTALEGGEIEILSAPDARGKVEAVVVQAHPAAPEVGFGTRLTLDLADMDHYAEILTPAQPAPAAPVITVAPRTPTPAEAVQAETGGRPPSPGGYDQAPAGLDAGPAVTAPAGTPVPFRYQTPAVLAGLVSQLQQDGTPESLAAIPVVQGYVVRAQQYEQGRQVPPQLLDQVTAAFKDPREPAQIAFRIISRAASKARDPELAARLAAAAKGVQDDFGEFYLGTLPDAQSRDTGVDLAPPFVSPYRTLSGADRASLDPETRRALLIQDIANSTRVLHPGTPPFFTVPGSVSQLQNQADNLFRQAQRQALQSEVAHATPAAPAPPPPAPAPPPAPSTVPGVTLPKTRFGDRFQTQPSPVATEQRGKLSAPAPPLSRRHQAMVRALAAEGGASKAFLQRRFRLNRSEASGVFADLQGAGIIGQPGPNGQAPLLLSPRQVQELSPARVTQKLQVAPRGPERAESLLAAAARRVADSGRATAPGLARRLGISPREAEALLKELQQLGVVSAPNSAGHRRVLMNHAQAEDAVSHAETLARRKAGGYVPVPTPAPNVKISHHAPKPKAPPKPQPKPVEKAAPVAEKPPPAPEKPAASAPNTEHPTPKTEGKVRLRSKGGTVVDVENGRATYIEVAPGSSGEVGGGFRTTEERLKAKGWTEVKEQAEPATEKPQGSAPAPQPEGEAKPQPKAKEAEQRPRSASAEPAPTPEPAAAEESHVLSLEQRLAALPENASFGDFLDALPEETRAAVSAEQPVAEEEALPANILPGQDAKGRLPSPSAAERPKELTAAKIAAVVRAGLDKVEAGQLVGVRDLKTQFTLTAPDPAKGPYAWTAHVTYRGLSPVVVGDPIFVNFANRPSNYVLNPPAPPVRAAASAVPKATPPDWAKIGARFEDDFQIRYELIGRDAEAGTWMGQKVHIPERKWVVTPQVGELNMFTDRGLHHFEPLPGEAAPPVAEGPRELTPVPVVEERNDELPTAPPVSTQVKERGQRAERAPGAKSQAAPKATEPAAVTLPAEQLGKKTTFTAQGKDYEGQWAIVEVGDLVTSHDDSLVANPAYPQEYQPRDRDELASQNQVIHLMQTLDPRQLGENVLAAHGAPVVAPSLLVESGNGRTIALRRLYGANQHRIPNYRGFLRSNAAAFGLTAPAVAKLKEPVLVRIRTEKLTEPERLAFVHAANARETLSPSAKASAKFLAARLTPRLMEWFSPGADLNLNVSANKDWVAGVLSLFPPNDLGDLIVDKTKLGTKQVELSRNGIMLATDAVFYYAYGDEGLLAQVTLAPADSPVKRVTGAMLQAAGRWSTWRDKIKTGHAYDLDVTPDLLAAVQQISLDRQRKKPAGGLLPDEGLPPVAQAIYQGLEERKGSGPAMASFLADIADLSLQVGDPFEDNNHPALFEAGEKELPTTREIVEAARRKKRSDDAGQASLLPASEAGPGAAPGGDGPEARATTTGPLGGLDWKAAHQQDLAERPVAPGMVRLYRAEVRPEMRVDRRPEWVREAQALRGHTAAQDRWFARDPELTQWYVDETDRGRGRVTSIDLPEKEIEKYRVINLPEVRQFSRDPENEWFLPADLAKQTHPVALFASTEGGKPLWEMTLPELDAAYQRAQESDREQLERLFGPEGAKRWRSLERRANSSTASFAQTEAASVAMDAMAEELSPADRNELYGIDQPHDVYTPEEIQAFRQGLSHLDDESAETLGKSLKYALSRVGHQTDPRDMTEREQVAYAQIKAAERIIRERGFDPGEVTKAALKGAIERHRDPEDAAFLLRRFLQPEAAPTSAAHKPFRDLSALWVKAYPELAHYLTPVKAFDLPDGLMFNAAFADGTPLIWSQQFTPPVETVQWMAEEGGHLATLFTRLAHQLLTDKERQNLDQVGLVVDAGKGGINLTWSGGRIDVFVNPFSRPGDAYNVYRGYGNAGHSPYQEAQRIALSMVHEIAHFRVHEEGDKLWDEMDRMVGQIGLPAFQRLEQAIVRLLTKGGTKHGFSPKYQKAREAYTAAVFLHGRPGDGGQPAPDAGGGPGRALPVQVRRGEGRAGKHQGRGPTGRATSVSPSGKPEPEFTYPEEGQEDQFLDAHVEDVRPAEPETYVSLLRQLMHDLTREFPELRAGGRYAQFHTLMHDAVHASARAKEEVKREIDRIFAHLSPAEKGLFERALYVYDLAENLSILKDRIKEGNQKLTDEEAQVEADAAIRFPLGKDRETGEPKVVWTPDNVRSTKALFMRRVAENDRVRKALEQRKQFVADVTDEMIYWTQRATGRKLDLPREDYMHHMVLLYAIGPDGLARLVASPTGGGRVKVVNRGFMKSRLVAGTTLAHNTSYVASELHWGSQAMADNVILKLVADLYEREDLAHMVEAIAKAQNFELLMKRLDAQAEKLPLQALPEGEFRRITGEDLYRGMNVGIASAFNKYGYMAANELLTREPSGRFDKLFEELADVYSAEAAEEDANEGETYVSPKIDQHLKDGIFQYSQWILLESRRAGYPLPGAGPAGMLLRAVALRQKEIDAILGEDKTDADRVALTDPRFKGTSWWQAKPGRRIFSGLTLADRIGAELMEGLAEEAKITKEDLHTMPVLGGMNRRMLLPDPIKRTLETLDDYKSETALSKVLQETVRPVKFAQLYNPLHTVDFFVRKSLNDLHALIYGGWPGTMKDEMIPATKLVTLYVVKGQIPSEAVTETTEETASGTRRTVVYDDAWRAREFRHFLRFGALHMRYEMMGIDTETEAAQIEMATKVGAYLATGLRGLAGAGKMAKAIFSFWGPEAISILDGSMRFAAYLAAMQEMAASPKNRPKNVGFAHEQEVKAVEGMGKTNGEQILDQRRRRAWLMADEMMVAYDKSPPAVGWLANHGFAPWLRWGTQNTRRIYRLLANPAWEADAAEKNWTTLVDKAQVQLLAEVAATGGKGPPRLPRDPSPPGEGGGGGGEGKGPPDAPDLPLPYPKSFRVGANQAMLALSLYVIPRIYQWGRAFLDPDSERDLDPKVRSEAHAILGHDPWTGKAMVWVRLSALDDVLAISDPWGVTEKVMQGKLTPAQGVMEMVLYNPLKEMLQLGGPYQEVVDVLKKENAYPDPLNPKYQEITTGRVLDVLGYGNVWRWATNQQRLQPSERLFKLVGVHEYGRLESNYYEVRDMARDYNGAPSSPGGAKSAKSAALYQFVQAAKAGDKKGAGYYLLLYQLKGGTPNGIRESVRDHDPLVGMNDDQAQVFMRTLDPGDRQKVRGAYLHYRHEVDMIAGQPQTVAFPRIDDDMVWLVEARQEIRSALREANPIETLSTAHPENAAAVEAAKAEREAAKHPALPVGAK